MSDFVDISSNNGAIDFAAYARDGHQLLVAKADESDTYTWGGFATAIRQASAAGLQTWAYHFARTEADGARHFLAACAPVMDQLDGLVLDYEANATPAAATAFMADVEAARTGKQLIVYAGAAKISETGLAHRPGWDWWVPAYGPSHPGPPPGWPQPIAWQFTDHATAAWIKGGTDESHLYVTPAQPAPAAVTVTPTVQEDDMAALVNFPNDPKNREFALTPSTAVHLPNPRVVADLQKAGLLSSTLVTVGQETLEFACPGITK